MTPDKHLFLPLLLLALLAGPAAASDKKANREREALRRVQVELQQAQGRVSSLEQEKAKLGQDLEAAGKARKSAEGRAARLNRELKAEQQQREALAKELEQVKQDLAASGQQLAETRKTLNDTGARLAQTSDELRRAQADKANLESIKTRNEREIVSCEDKNLKLYQTGRELMVRFEQKSCGEILAQKEPFTGLKRVEIENLLEEYRDKLDEQKRVKPPGG